MAVVGFLPLLLYSAAMLNQGGLEEGGGEGGAGGVGIVACVGALVGAEGNCVMAEEEQKEEERKQNRVT